MEFSTMPNATVRANARALPKATNRRAALAGLGAVLAAGAAGVSAGLPPFAGGPSTVAEDREILNLRIEFERLEETRAPILEKHNELSWTFRNLLQEHGYDYDAAIAADTDASEPDKVERQLEPLTERAFDIVNRMLALQAQTPGGVAAVAGDPQKRDAVKLLG
jgi:hypothetical protein